VWLWLAWLNGGGVDVTLLRGGWLATGDGMALAGVVYAGASLLLGSPEAHMILGLVRRRVRHG
ncbi:MAG: hypothetical protein WBO46_11145, partial [Caldilineaceae bacterium]